MTTKIGKATRPIFIPQKNDIGIVEKNITFDWHMGMSAVVKQRSMLSLHEKAKEQGYNSILEASSKSQQQLGIQLSAFILKNDEGYSVENLFQSSKVFQSDQQFLDLLSVSPREAKRDIRLRNSGEMIKFCFNGLDFPLEPKSLFYDWLYTKTLFKTNRNLKLKEDFINSNFNAFSDIEFNPKKSFSCQARTLALCLSLYRNKSINDFIENPIEFANKFNLYIKNNQSERNSIDQNRLF